MAVLRRVLYLQALIWAIAGAALASAPQLVLETLGGQVPLAANIWARIAGILLVTLGMVLVLVGHQVEEAWWWCWAFVFSNLALAVLGALKALWRTGPASSPVLWWALSGASAALAIGLLWGLGRAGQQKPPA